MILPAPSEIARGLSRWAVYVGLALLVGVVTGELLARGCGGGHDKDVFADGVSVRLDRIEERIVNIADAQKATQAVTADRVAAENERLDRLRRDGEELERRIEALRRELEDQ